MSIPTNTFVTYSAVGNREDLSDLISNISPVDTKFFNLIGAGPKPKNTKIEWQTDVLAAAASNAQLEGDTYSTSAVVATSRVYNMLQIQRKTFGISKTQDEMDSAGRKTESAYQTMKAMKELAKDIEYAFLKGVRNDGAAGTARQMRGAVNWTTTNLDKDAGATLNANGTVTGGTARALTEQLIKDTMQTVFSAGGNPSKMFLGPFQKQQVSSFAGLGNYRTAVEGKKLMSTVDVYVTDFATLEVIPHRIIDTDIAFIVDAETWKKRTLRPTQKVHRSSDSDSDQYAVIVEHSLEAKAENGNGRITDLTTS